MCFKNLQAVRKHTKESSFCDFHCSVQISICNLSLHARTLLQCWTIHISWLYFQEISVPHKSQETLAHMRKRHGEGDDRNKHYVILLNKLYSFLLPSPPPSSPPDMDVGYPFIPPPLLFLSLFHPGERDTIVVFYDPLDPPPTTTTTTLKHTTAHTNL